MSWHRVAILVVCGFLLQCTSNVNTSSNQSYREALRRRLSTVAWCPPPQQSPCVVIPYPYHQTGSPTPRAQSYTNHKISQNTAVGWPEYRIKVPLYRGQPMKTNIIIELPLFMFPQLGQTDTKCNEISTSSSSSDSSITSNFPDAQSSSQSVKGQNTSTLPPKHVNKQEDLAECNPDEIITNDHNPSVHEFPEDNTTGNGLSTDKTEVSCDNESSSISTNPIEIKPSVPESGNEADSEQTDECMGAISNEPIEIEPGYASEDDSANTPKLNDMIVRTEEPACPDTGELTSNNTPCSTVDCTDTPCPAADFTDTPGSTKDDIKTEECSEPCSQPEGETTATEDAAECSTPRTDDGTEIASSAASEATSIG